MLPCLDEAGALPWVLARLPEGARAIVVDNGSSDGSPDIARDLGATVVAASQRGYGAACHAGLTAASADLVAFCDCDASLDPGDSTRLAAPVLAGEADLVLGRRRVPGGWRDLRGTAKAWPPHARLANVELARRIRRRTGYPLHDLGPIRVARREGLLALGQIDRRSGYPLETVVRAADAGWRVQEMDVEYRPREGRSKVTGTWRGTWNAVQDMSKVLRS